MKIFAFHVVCKEVRVQPKCEYLPCTMFGMGSVLLFSTGDTRLHCLQSTEDSLVSP